MANNRAWGGTIPFPKTKWEKRKIHICDTIVLTKYRNRGFDATGIQLLCNAAKENGISILYDGIAADNPSYKLFLKNGFEIDCQDDTIVMVKKLFPVRFSVADEMHVACRLLKWAAWQSATKGVRNL